MKQRVVPMIGNRYGRLLVIAEGGKKNREAIWICRCDCGNETQPISGSSLRSGHTQSCGCLKSLLTVERNTKHSLCKTRLYRIWSGMKSRCANPRHPKYSRYGGRGITVCKEWESDFQAFWDWAMTHGYRDDLTIDRENNDGDYCPENCRWATNESQCNNKGANIAAEINGETKTLAEWSKETGIKYRTIHARYNRGWTGESLIRKV